MIKVFEAQHLPEAHLVCGLLEAHGIAAEAKGHDLFALLGVGSGVPGVLPTVWIADPSAAEQALALVAQFQRGHATTAVGATWQCPQCQEAHEAQFSSCWKCGTERPSPASA
jgi:hypothetical protein